MRAAEARACRRSAVKMWKLCAVTKTRWPAGRGDSSAKSDDERRALAMTARVRKWRRVKSREGFMASARGIEEHRKLIPQGAENVRCSCIRDEILQFVGIGAQIV